MFDDLIELGYQICRQDRHRNTRLRPGRKQRQASIFGSPLRKWKARNPTFVLVACVILLVQAVGCEAPPKDDELLTRFHENRESFEQLLQLMLTRLKDRTFVAIVPEDDPNAGPLMTKLGIKNANANRLFVTFTCTRNKGYKFWLTEPKEAVVLDSLDGDLPGNSTLYLRKIENGWFLFHRMVD